MDRISISYPIKIGIIILLLTFNSLYGQGPIYDSYSRKMDSIGLERLSMLFDYRHIEDELYIKITNKIHLKPHFNVKVNNTIRILRTSTYYSGLTIIF